MSLSDAEQIRQLFRARPLRPIDLQSLRAGFAETMALFPLPADVTRAPADADGVPGEWIETPGVARDRVILYLHGGGFMIGSAATHAELAARLGRAAGARALSIDYRLAPEHPFPAGLEDAVTAYRFLLAQGIAPAHIAVAGDSAGGGLTLSLLLALRDRDLPAPAGAVGFSPWVDLAGTGETMVTNAGRDPLVSAEGVVAMAGAYLRGADPRATPLASPLYASLERLPPLFLQAGTAEVLLDDTRRLAAKARGAGVSVEVDLWEDHVHGFQAVSTVPAAREAVERAGAFLKARLG